MIISLLGLVNEDAGLGVCVGKLDVLWLPYWANLGTGGTYYSLYFFSEGLVEQCVYKGIDSRVEQNHRVRNDD